MQEMHTLQARDIDWLYKPYQYFGGIPDKGLVYFNELMKCMGSKINEPFSGERDILILSFEGQKRTKAIVDKITTDDKYSTLIVVCGKLSNLPKRSQGLIYGYMKDIKSNSLEELYYRTFIKIIKDYNIKIIYMTGDGSIIERCAILAAHHSGIYTMLHPHGYISPIVTDYLFHEKARFAVFGQEQEDILIENGFKKEQIRQVGAMWFP